MSIRRTTYVVLFICLALLQISLWGSANGIFAIWGIKNKIAKEQNFNAKLLARNKSLLEQAHYLKTDKNQIATLARKQLGMIGKGEKFYQFKPLIGPSSQVLGPRS